MKLLSFFTLILFFSLSLNATSPSDFEMHGTFDGLLQKYVSTDGKVDYKGFKSDELILDEYLSKLASNKPANTESKNTRLAYWINLYNASTIKLILKNYPVASITDIGGGKPWDIKWIQVDGKIYSLNQIENDIIRPEFKDARIHFAVNCAAKSCPTLYNHAWKATTLDEDLDRMAKNFINNSSYNTLDKGNVKISKIFEWYASDFGDVLRFINKYASTTIENTENISYNSYNWELNKK